MTTQQQGAATAWDGFRGNQWCDAIDVRDFIQRNYTPYEGGAFLAGPTGRTLAVWRQITDRFPEEHLDQTELLLPTAASHIAAAPAAAQPHAPTAPQRAKW
ncbi:hypothetical protein [Kitasatospora terrestris]|uniref:Formate acetyltransferase n=1 Tax=Kitasatospora terrestris TaxID=258051 RepID=A0ABP9ERS3_9ACTN